MAVVPVFVSSTFRDFHAERDAFPRLVAPRLDEALAPFGARVELLDLRWGVATESAEDEEAAHRQVLDVCLREVDRCRPLFVGLVGDRLGWVPARSRLEYAARRAGINGAIPLGPEPGLSVTALEFWHGALASDAQAVFALRTLAGEVPAAWVDPTPAGAAWLRAGVAQAHQRDPHRVKLFEYVANVVRGRIEGADLESFADQLVDVLTPLVIARAMEVGAPGASAYETAVRLQTESTSQVFLGRDELVDQVLDSFDTATQGRGIVLQGPSGIGKTAVWLAVSDRFRAQGRIVASVMVGAGPGSSTVDEVIWLLAGQLGLDIPTGDPFVADIPFGSIAGALGIGDAPEPVTGKPLWAWWMTALKQMPPSTMVAIDGLDRLAPGAGRDSLAALPAALSRCPVDFLVTTAADPQGAYLHRRGWTIKQVPSLPSRAVSHAAMAWAQALGGRELPKKAIVSMSMRPRSGLWVRLAVEELTWLDADDFAAAEELQSQGVQPEHALAAMLVKATGEMPDDDLQLARRLLGRVEQLFEKPWQANLFVACLSLTRSGLTPYDLSAIVGADAQVISRARWVLGSQLVQRDKSGRLTINHPVVREAARTNIAAAGGDTAIHQRIASHLRRVHHRQEATANVRDAAAWADLLWHAMLAGDASSSLVVLADPAPLSAVEAGAVVSAAVIAGRPLGAPAFTVMMELTDRRIPSRWWLPLLLAFASHLNERTTAENLVMGRVITQAAGDSDDGLHTLAGAAAFVDTFLAESLRRARAFADAREAALSAAARCEHVGGWASLHPDVRDGIMVHALATLSASTLPLGNLVEARTAAVRAEEVASRLPANMMNDSLAIMAMAQVVFVIDEESLDSSSSDDLHRAAQRCRAACQDWRFDYEDQVGDSPATMAAAVNVMTLEFTVAGLAGTDPNAMARTVDEIRRWLSVSPDDLQATRLLILGLLYRAWGEREAGRYAEAGSALDEAEGLVGEWLEMDPDDLEAKSTLAVVCNERGAQLLDGPVRLQELAQGALRWFQQGLEHNLELARANPTDRWATAKVMESLMHVIEAAVAARDAVAAQTACSDLESLSADWLRVDPHGAEARDSRYSSALNRVWVVQEFNAGDHRAVRAAHTGLLAAVDALGEVAELDDDVRETRSRSLAALRALDRPVPTKKPIAVPAGEGYGKTVAGSTSASERLGAIVDAEPNCGGRKAVLTLIKLMLKWPALPRKLKKRYGVLHMRDRKELGLTLTDLRGYESPTPIDWDNWDAAINDLDERLPNLEAVVRRAVRAGVTDWEEVAGYLNLPDLGK